MRSDCLYPKAGIRAWITHREALGINQGFSLTVEQLTDSTLGSEESAELALACSVYLEVDTGGICYCNDAGR